MRSEFCETVKGLFGLCRGKSVCVGEEKEEWEPLLGTFTLCIGMLTFLLDCLIF